MAELKQEEIIEKIEFDNEVIDEHEDLSAQRKIFTEAGDPEVISLYNRWKRGTLNLQPDFQRNFFGASRTVANWWNLFYWVFRFL